MPIKDTDSDFTKLCKKLEHYETDPWAAAKILEHELMTPVVVDPCTGTGILADAAKAAGYDVVPIDIQDWGYPDVYIHNFLTLKELPFDSFSVMMNPPFKYAVHFIKKSFDLGARKVLCFQRFSYWESEVRRGFWEEFQPARIYVCGNRAHCWRHDLTAEERDSSTPTAHAWFVFEPAHPRSTVLGHIYKD